MKLLKKYSLLITIVAIIVVLTIVIDVTKITNVNTVKAVNGYLDLSNYNLNNGPIKLNGEWELYKNQLLTYQDFQNGNIRKTQLQLVPGTFKPNHISDEKGYGYGTYRLRIKTKNTNDILGLKILTMSTSYKLMINDKVVATNGIVADNKADYKSNYRPQVVFFETDNKTFDIIIQVANYTYNRTGMWHSIVFGNHQQIVKINNLSTKRAIFFLGGILFLLVYQIGILYLQRKNNKANFYLIISLSIMLIRIMFTGDYIITELINNIPVSFIAWVEYMTIIWAPTVVALFNYSIFKEEVNRFIIRIIIVLTMFNTLLVTVLPTNIYTNYITLIEVWYLAVFLYLIWSNYKSIKKGKSFAVLCIIGYASVVCTCFIDTLYYKNIIYVIDGGITPYSVFGIIIIQVIIIARSYEESFEDVRILSKELIKQDKIKDDFLAYTSHEIRTPLHGMISLVENIVENGTNLYDTQKENLNDAVKSGKRLSDLVTNILDYSKLKNNDLKLELKDITLLSVVQFVINTQKYLAQNNNILLTYDINPNVKVFADENRLIQILTNLLTNAIKFTKKGRINISCREINGFAEICVEDSGCGIPKDKIQSIFEAYQQLDNNSRALGTGLGLNISKQLVELHGGEIWVESSEYVGSKFYFTIKIGRGNSSLVSSNVSTRLKQLNSVDFTNIKIYQNHKKTTILIVDDNTINLQALINILSAEDYKLIVTSNSGEALKAINKYKIDLAILDIMMDNISGYDLCQKIRKKHTLFQMPVLLLTAQINNEAMMHGFKLGANDFLTKPFNSEELKARVKTLISMKQSAEEAINNEAAFLQAQIKPHFIYNALNVIVSLCDTDPVRAGDLLVEFSSYLRKSFDFSNTKKLVTLDSEIDYIKSYLLIEQARFVNKIECNFDIQEQLGLMIPPLILQPLVENSIKHGILTKNGNGQINIKVYKENCSVLIIVEDNGKGIANQKLIKILNDRESSDGVGLKNINKRLLHYYGTGLKIESELHKGCKITINIPDNFVKEDYYESNDN